MLRLLLIVVLSILAAVAAGAQQEAGSEKARQPGSKSTRGNVLGEVPDQVLKLVKLKGVVENVDTDKRTITVAAGKHGDKHVLSFAQPAGREQIDVTKKLAKTFGKKKMLLEELKPGSKVSLQYYQALDQLMELVVQTSGGA